jgi:hypothetical protein
VGTLQGPLDVGDWGEVGTVGMMEVQVEDEEIVAGAETAGNRVE